jgi:hypothetical protein
MKGNEIAIVCRVRFGITTATDHTEVLSIHTHAGVMAALLRRVAFGYEARKTPVDHVFGKVQHQAMALNTVNFAPSLDSSVGRTEGVSPSAWSFYI